MITSQRSLKIGTFVCTAAMLGLSLASAGAWAGSAEATPAPTAAASAATEVAPAAPSAADLAAAAVQPAGKEPVHIGVAKGMTYDSESKSWIFDGDVKASYKGDEISADRIILPDDGRTLRAEGHVLLKRDQQELRGDTIDYDLDSRVGKIVGAAAKVTGDGMKGFVFLTGREVDGGTDRYALLGGRLTTCDLANPHWHIEAKSIEVWAGEKIVVRGLSYYEKGLRLFYWPYFVFPLRKENTLVFPKVGYSAAQGLSVNASYNYYSSESFNGLLHLDWYQKLGLGAGIDHTFRIGALNSSGTVTAYVLGDKVTRHADVKTQLTYNQPLPLGWKSALTATRSTTGISGPPGAERVATSGLLTLNKQSKAYTGDISASINDTSDTGSATDERAVVHNTITLGKTTTLSADATYVHQMVASGLTPATDRTAYTYKVELKDAQPGRTISLVTDQAINPDRLGTDPATVITWNDLARLPELSVQITDLGLPKKLGPLPLPAIGFTGAAGEYRETATGLITQQGRGDAQIGFRDAPVKLGGSSRLELTGLGRLSAYEDSERREAVSTGVRLVQSVGSFATMKVGYSYDDNWGSSPFRFDALSKAETVSTGLDLKAGGGTVSLGTSYNLAAISSGSATAWGDLSASAAYTASEQFGLSANAAYNMSSQRWRAIAATIKLKPSDAVHVDGSLRYNFDTGKFETFSGAADLRLPANIRLGYAGQWDNTLQAFTKNDLSLGYHQHCRTFKLVYSQSTKSFWLEYQLDAFPDNGVTVGASGTSGLILDVNGLDTLLK